MAIQNLAKNQTIRVYYRSSAQQDGLNVRFDFFNVSGLYSAQNAPYDGFVAGKGVYYYDFTAPNQDTYVLGIAYLNDKQDVEPIVFKVGQPTQQLLFYYTEKTIVGGLDYRVYDEQGVILQEGQLSQVSDTYFWYVEFTSPLGAVADDNFFFEVDDTYSVESFNPAMVDTDVTTTITVFNINSSLIAPVVSGTSFFQANTLAANFSIINPQISGDAIIPISVFEATSTVITVINTEVQEGSQTVQSNLISPTIRGDALVVVSVFEADTAVPESVKVGMQQLTSSLIAPQVKADAVVDVSALILTVNLNSNVIATQSIPVSVIDSGFTLNQPTVVAETNAPPVPITGYPYDNHLTLGAAPGFPMGVVSGKRTRFITIQFKICKKDFVCEEGIYQREAAKFSSRKIEVKNIDHKPKKAKISILGNISRHDGSKVKLQVKEFEKV